jgi:hypothetical protein
MVVVLGVMTGLTSSPSPSIHCAVAFLQKHKRVAAGSRVQNGVNNCLGVMT